MVPVQRATAAGATGLLALLAGLGVAGVLGTVATLVGAGCGVGLLVLVGWAAARTHRALLGPADAVTFGRACLACAVAALVTEGLVDGPLDRRRLAVLVVLAAVALVLDAVDGRVARRTATASRFGARFDGEADAWLILVLSVQVASTLGAWVLAIGAARYVFGAAGLVLPWLRAPLPPRRWRKVVAAVQGIVLVVVTAGVLPTVVEQAAVVVALALLAESFGRDVAWLRRHRHPTAAAGLDARRVPLP